MDFTFQIEVRTDASDCREYYEKDDLLRGATMPNDAKWGLLAGVAGVCVVAVLFFHDRPPAAPVPAITAAPDLTPSAKSPHLFGKKPAPNDLSKNNSLANNADREPQGKAVSRSVAK